MNNFYIGINLPSAAGTEITLINGIVSPDKAEDFETGETIKVQEEALTTVKDYSNDEGVVDNKLFDLSASQGSYVNNLVTSAQNGILTISGCTFVGGSSFTLENTALTQVIIENCTFVDCNSWSLQIGGSNDGGTKGDYTDDVPYGITYIIRNNTFLNCARGINIQRVTSTGNIIEGNTFILANDAKANALQIADYRSEYYAEGSAAGLQPLNGETYITVRNNNFEAAAGILNVHDSLIASGNTFGAAETEYYKNVITFENNTISSSIANRAIPDPDANPSTTETQTYLNNLVNYFNSIIR